jgi:CTP synthase
MHVIPAYDLKTIYEAPLAYHRGGLDQAVLDAFGITPAPRPTCPLGRRDGPLTHAEGEVRVAIVGKYTQLEDAYKSIAEALTHGGMANRTRVRAEWIDAEISSAKTPPPTWRLPRHPRPRRLWRTRHRRQDQGRPLRPRKEDPLPRHLPWHADGGDRGRAQPGGLPDAGSEEFDHEAGAKRFTPVVYHLKEWVQGNHTVERRKAGDAKGGTMRLGAYTANLAPGSKVAQVYGTTVIEERHRHRYEVDIKYRDKLEACGLIFSGMSPDGRLPEIVEVKDHPWFIGVQFHPELKSKPFAPHPLFADFVRAAVEDRQPGRWGQGRGCAWRRSWHSRRPVPGCGRPA